MYACFVAHESIIMQNEPKYTLNCSNLVDPINKKTKQAQGDHEQRRFCMTLFSTGRHMFGIRSVIQEGAMEYIQN